MISRSLISVIVSLLATFVVVEGDHVDCIPIFPSPSPTDAPTKSKGKGMGMMGKGTKSPGKGKGKGKGKGSKSEAPVSLRKCCFFFCVVTLLYARTSGTSRLHILIRLLIVLFFVFQSLSATPVSLRKRSFLPHCRTATCTKKQTSHLLLIVFSSFSVFLLLERAFRGSFHFE